MLLSIPHLPGVRARQKDSGCFVSRFLFSLFCFSPTALFYFTGT